MHSLRVAARTGCRGPAERPSNACEAVAVCAWPSLQRLATRRNPAAPQPDRALARWCQYLWRTVISRRRGCASLATPEPNELQIAALGAQGDGIAETDAGRVYVAFA